MGPFGGVRGGQVRSKIKNIKKKFGLVKTIPMIPHNPGFGWILEMTLLGGRWEAVGRPPGPFGGVLRGQVRLKMKINQIILTGQSIQFR